MLLCQRTWSPIHLTFFYVCLSPLLWKWHMHTGTSVPWTTSKKWVSWLLLSCWGLVSLCEGGPGYRNKEHDHAQNRHWQNYKVTLFCLGRGGPMVETTLQMQAYLDLPLLMLRRFACDENCDTSLLWHPATNRKD